MFRAISYLFSTKVTEAEVNKVEVKEVSKAETLSEEDETSVPAASAIPTPPPMEDASSLITRTDLHFVLLGTAVVLSLVGNRLDLLPTVGGASLVLQLGFSALQISAPALIGCGVDPTAVRYLISLVCWVAVLVVVCCSGACLGVSAAGRPSEQVLLAVTVAIGAGTQPILSNFAAGLLLILQRPYRVGDWITVGSETFQVTSIMLFFTQGKSANAHVSVPNSQAVGATISNFSARPSGAPLLIVPVHVRTNQQPCSVVRKAIAAAAEKYEVGVAAALESAGVVADTCSAADAFKKCVYHGPLAISSHGMRWELRVEAPLQAHLACAALANECLHDLLMAAGIQIHEAVHDGFM